MRSVFRNNVIIIGADHHNTLAAIRCFGKLKCNLQVLVHTSHEDLENVCVSHSRYAIGKTACVPEKPEAMIQWLRSKANDEKQILFPCSDLAAYVIDTNYQELSSAYVLPGFKGAPGKVANLMDKWEQSRFAAENGLLMAKSWSLTKTDGFSVPEDIVYPCIVKPEVSAFGNKGDIVVCENAAALCAALERLAAQGYEALLVQQFLLKEYEICAYGCLTDNKELCAGGMIRKLREYPTGGGGSSSFAQFTQDERGKPIYERTLSALYEMGYRGQYDLDILVCKDGAYLNEINFRHGGNGYGLVDNGVYAPYYWCVDAIGASVPGKIKTAVKNGKYQMDELTDMRHVAEKRISFFSWLVDLLKASALCKFNRQDLRGTYVYYAPFLGKCVRKNTRVGKKQ